MAKMIVDDAFCKGCGLCVDACPLHIVCLLYTSDAADDL